MTWSAWMMLVPTWAIITWFTVYYFIKVLKVPGKDPEGPTAPPSDVNAASHSSKET